MYISQAIKTENLTPMDLGISSNVTFTFRASVPKSEESNAEAKDPNAPYPKPKWVEDFPKGNISQKKITNEKTNKNKKVKEIAKNGRQY